MDSACIQDVILRSCRPNLLQTIVQKTAEIGRKSEFDEQRGSKAIAMANGTNRIVVLRSSDELYADLSNSVIEGVASVVSLDGAISQGRLT